MSEKGFPEAFAASVAARIKKMKEEGPSVMDEWNALNAKPSVVMTTPRAGMSIAADYFGIDGPSCAEVAASIRKAHEEQAPFVGFVHHQLDPNVMAVPTRTIEDWQHRIEELRMEIARHGLSLTAVISHPDGQEAKAWGKPVFGSRLGEFRKGHLTQWTPPSADFVMTELEDPDSMLNQGLADALDARELDGPSPNDVEAKCFPYLQEDVHIESCPIVGKGITDNCKHLIGRLDYCDQCEHEHDEPIDLSGETI